jgi:hypothetical protein
MTPPQCAKKILKPLDALSKARTFTLYMIPSLIPNGGSGIILQLLVMGLQTRKLARPVARRLFMPTTQPRKYNNPPPDKTHPHIHRRV